MSSEAVNGEFKPKKQSRLFNNAMMSDVTIRFGKEGELKINAHKVILASYSDYFRACFTKYFVTTWHKGDLHPSRPVLDLFLVLIRDFQEADYFMIPMPRAAILGIYPEFVDKASEFVLAHENNSVNVDKFGSIISEIYKLPDIAQKDIKDVLFSRGVLCSPIDKKAAWLIQEISEKNPEFGTDFLGYLMKGLSATANGQLMLITSFIYNTCNELQICKPGSDHERQTATSCATCRTTTSD
ncbi:hypothetical protein B0J11DRAFT_593484 [Dendryphion nanum]|uniref:BTB domain-containing protein n=1 Tax=Dendryphion nanum TaxID=256645 RepID=A0A9P9DBC3_9PLEO|nr:hypothetical protein B0J11DRAFT_593484 [Dendryphion nanum]